jgi:CRISPR system Cascade subunit CasE
MMFLSALMIDVGDNPDRPRPGRLWLRNLYRVHQRLCMAFPGVCRKQDDPEMVQPYRSEDFGDGQVHVRREDSAGFLFRIDPHQPGGPVVVLVQSALEPDWGYAFGLCDPRTDYPVGNAGCLLAALPETKHFNLTIEAASKFRFRLLANPVRRISKNSLDARGQPVDEQWLGKHVPVPEESLWKWLKDRAEPAWAQRKRDPNEQSPGFRIVEETAVCPGFVYTNKTRDPAEGRRYRSARYDGILEVTDPAALLKTLAAGIGPAKAFGFGLLSIAPLH